MGAPPKRAPLSPPLKPPVRKSAPPAQKPGAVVSNKKLSVIPWNADDEGEKILIFGRSGIGKSSLAAQRNNAAWIGIDDGARRLINPNTGNRMNVVDGIETFEDVRAALQSDIFDGYSDIIIDTVTQLQTLALESTFRRVRLSNNDVPKNIEDYGWHKGYRHWYDTMATLLTDCDRHVRDGRNIIMLAQGHTIRWPNAAGEDFIVEAPNLYHGNNVSTLNTFVEWCDHVLRIDYTNIEVDKQKKASSTKTRAVFVHPEAHFIAKSRTIPADYDVVEFAHVADDSIWRLIFGD